MHSFIPSSLHHLSLFVTTFPSLSHSSLPSQTLYTYPDSFRAYKVLIAAQYSGAKVKVAPNFELGKTNRSPDFLKKFPLGKVESHDHNVWEREDELCPQ